jgi:hypothetical protein
MQVLVNILEKAATSPFTLLGAMFGGGPELSYVDFQPGHSDLAPAELPKIDKLSKALYERPALRLEIAATADPATDSPALARMKLEDQIRSLRAKELIAAGTPAETVQSLQVDPTNYARLVKSLYRDTVGTNAPATNAAAAPVPAASSVAVPSEAVAADAKRARSRTEAIVKGGVVMEQGKARAISVPNGVASIEITPPPAPAKPAAAEVVSAPPANAAPANPAPAGELSQEQMEAALAAGMEITADDLRALMLARARSVQAALARTGKVEAERMDLLSPRPVDPKAKGEARANLSLD